MTVEEFTKTSAIKIASNLMESSIQTGLNSQSAFYSDGRAMGPRFSSASFDGCFKVYRVELLEIGI